MYFSKFSDLVFFFFLGSKYLFLVHVLLPRKCERMRENFNVRTCEKVHSAKLDVCIFLRSFETSGFNFMFSTVCYPCLFSCLENARKERERSKHVFCSHNF